MAQPAPVHTPEPQSPLSKRRARPQFSVVPPVLSDLAADPKAPTVGVHPVAIEIALAAVVWFLAAMAFFFAGPVDTDIALVVVIGFAIVFFGLTLGLARWAANDPRWLPRKRPTFAEFVGDNVAIETGTISAREALVQIVTLPLVLAAGATAIGIVFTLAA